MEGKIFDLSNADCPKTQIYATIREVSKYRHQQPINKEGNPIPFPVVFCVDSDPFWPVKGGNGGNYTLFDVDLWIQSEENYIQLPVHGLEGKIIKK